jgi:hypothetical protein
MPLGVNSVVVNSILLEVADPDSGVVAVHVCPVSVVWVIVSEPEIDSPTVKLRSPAGPLSAVQVPAAFEPLCVSRAVTASLTVTPPVTNCHVPFQVPSTSMSLGDVFEWHEANASAQSEIRREKRLSVRRVRRVRRVPGTN